MKQFLYSVLVIVITLILEFVLSLLFDWSFIQDHISRQILVWFMLLVVFFVGFRLLQNINTENKETVQNSNNYITVIMKSKEASMLNIFRAFILFFIMWIFDLILT